MKIVVCIKQIQHLYARTGEDPATHFIREEDRLNIVNPYDEIAVEEAIRIKEKVGDGEVILITLGNLIAEKNLRKCLAMGANRLIQIDDPSHGRMDPWGTSVALSKAVARLNPDLVLCGKIALDDNGGQVGSYIAELLDLPYVTNVVRLELYPDHKRMRIHRAFGKGDKEVVESPLPAVLGVDKGLNDPRYPKLINLFWALSQKIEIWDLNLLGLTSDDLKAMTEVVEVFYPRPRPKKIFAPDSSLSGYERTLLLLSGSRIEKAGYILEGAPEELASEVIQFLKGKNLL